MVSTNLVNVDADDLAACTDFLRRKEYVEAGATAQITDCFSLVDNC